MYRRDRVVLSLIKELYRQKITGELDERDETFHQQTKWRNKLDYDCIKNNMKHYEEEMRLDTLKLIVESKKSTLRFIPQELDVILTFLEYNIGEKFEFVPSIKKVFKRLKESLAVFRRNIVQLDKLKSCEEKAHEKPEVFKQLEREFRELASESLEYIRSYSLFFAKIRDQCLAGICPGATHIKKRNCLRIIQLAEEFLANEFKDVTWNERQANQIFQCLLLDTYETNKDIAFKIIQTIAPETLKLNDPQKVHEILDVGLKLGNCMRPIDSITASYMLKVSLLSPIIKEILKERIDTDMDDATLQVIQVILEHLKDPVELANENIIAATARHSLYGYIFCINSLVASVDFKSMNPSNVNYKYWMEIVQKMITICFKLNKAVSLVVNNSSPEGHLPMDLDVNGLNIDGEMNGKLFENIIVTPQMVLLCSWRTVKEVSLLFGFLTTKFSIEGEDNNTGLLSKQQVVQIGEHLVTLLCETKHRGAFEQAHVGFEQLCTRLWRLKQKCLSELPKIWLHQILLAITGLSKGNEKLCATRRSAGVPFMVQALVASEPAIKSKSDAAIFHSVIKILLTLTEIDDESQLPVKSQDLISQYFQPSIEIMENNHKLTIDSNSPNQVTLTEVKTHALNILRALFKHAQLGELARVYAADGLIASIRSYDEKTWAERNAATLLYSALITRIFGVQRSKDYLNLPVHNKMTCRVFFEKYPKLLPFMLRELKLFVDAIDSPIRPSVQSILLLLSRLYVSNNELVDGSCKNEQFIILVSSCAKSQIYKTRELAARAVIPLLTQKTVCSHMNELLEKIINEMPNNNFNLIHGYLLQALEISKSGLLKNCELCEVNVYDFMDASEWIINNLSADNNDPACYPIAAIYVEFLDIFLTLYEAEMEYPEFPYVAYQSVMIKSISYIIDSDKMKNRPGKEMFEESAVKLIIHWGLMSIISYGDKSRTEDYLSQFWCAVFNHNNDRVRILGFENIRFTVAETTVEEIQEPVTDHALEAAFVTLNEKKSNNPDLYDAIYEFLADFLGSVEMAYDLEKCDDEGQIAGPYHRYNSERLLQAAGFMFNTQRESASFLTFLNNVMQASRNYNDEKPQGVWRELLQKYKFYEICCRNSWTGSADVDRRLGIAERLHFVYMDVTKFNRKIWNVTILDWWTSLLRLLVDDNKDVRLAAARVVSLTSDNAKFGFTCVSEALRLFFEKFNEAYKNDVSVIFAAYFVWSVALSEDDYQMDESDVFNKCFNYEAYEPLLIANYCDVSAVLTSKFDPNRVFPDTLKEWLSNKLNMNVAECINARSLITSYKSRVPQVNECLEDLLDPTYNDKLLQIMVFEKFAVLLDKNHQFVSWDGEKNIN